MQLNVLPSARVGELSRLASGLSLNLCMQLVQPAVNNNLVPQLALKGLLMSSRLCYLVLSHKGESRKRTMAQISGHKMFVRANYLMFPVLSALLFLCLHHSAHSPLSTCLFILLCALICVLFSTACNPDMHVRSSCVSLCHIVLCPNMTAMLTPHLKLRLHLQVF